MTTLALDGRSAFVTGGGTGIGAAIALSLADAGAAVTITGRREEPLQAIADRSDRIRWSLMDVTDEASVVRTIADAGDVDIMIANAGVAETQPLRKNTLDFWDRVIATNLTGVMLCLRETVPGMAERGWGRAIAISSVAGLHGFKYGSAYTASKHGVLGLIKSVSDEVMTKGVTVNAICPGYVETPIVDRGAANITAKTGLSDAEARQTLGDLNPFGRLITVDEVSSAALWLCGPGSGAVTGVAIPINGGQV
ncbi:MAG: SDR family NAD(P)-dependent oxidoreductase [Pseudomonadota bacterium]